MPGNLRATLARTSDFSFPEPNDATRAKAFLAWLSSLTGYLRSPGTAKSDVGSSLRVLAVKRPPAA
jgi:hypothetical protein